MLHYVCEIEPIWQCMEVIESYIKLYVNNFNNRHTVRIPAVIINRILPILWAKALIEKKITEIIKDKIQNNLSSNCSLF